tara:strand:+ start:596 stop:943 length:348 start_codon:yes stop_codon:yes gene_type:complete
MLQRWKKVTLICGTVVGLFSAAAALGYKIDRPLMKSEHDDSVRAMDGRHVILAGNVKNNTIAILERKVNTLQERAWRIEDRMAKVGRQPELIDRHRQYVAQMQEAKAKLVKVRGW